MMHDPAVVNPRQPWAVSFGVGQVFIGCLVAGAIFMLLIFIWLVALVPPEVLATTDPPTTVGQLTLALGGGGALLFVLVGPTVALGLGWLLRATANQSVHVLVFAVTGALVGALVGWRFGPDLASALGSSMGAATGLTRMIMSRYARV